MNERIIRVWDLPTRLFHWLLVALVIGAMVSVKIGGNAMIWHGRFGHMIFGLIVFRIVWGLVGSSTARFASFVRGPGAVAAYVRGRWQGVGHNPLGAYSVLALLGLFGFQALSGLFANDDIAFRGPLAAMLSGDLSTVVSGWHRQTEWFLYGLVGLHVAAVVFYSRVRKDDLLTPMITGHKRVTTPGLEGSRGGGAVALIVAIAFTALALWATSGVFNPPPPPPVPDMGW